MSDNRTKDFDFDVSESTLDPFKGILQFNVQNKIEIKNFEFSTHEMGCRRSSGRSIKYGLKLTLNGKLLFMYYKKNVDVQVSNKLILTPGNTYKLETWLGGHRKLKSDQIGKLCQYHYAAISRSDKADHAPFEFIFSDEEHEEPSNKTCLYVIEYEILD